MPETTENFHRVPTGKKKKKGDKIRTITISKNIKALYNVDTKEIITYLFDRDSYTMKDAKKWVKEHKDNAIHRQLIEIDDLMERRKILMADINSDIYERVMEIVDKKMRDEEMLETTEETEPEDPEEQDRI